MSEDFINIEKKPDDKKELTFSIVVLFVIILVIGIFVLSREYSDALRSTVSHFMGEEKEEVVETKAEEEVAPAYEERSFYKETAESGDGFTHLARRAIGRYLQEEEKEVVSERKIYMEDYVQKKISSPGELLETGDEIEISKEIIEEALEEANKLSEEDLRNLEQYTALVFS